MKNLLGASVFITLGFGLFSCNAEGDNPGHAYMPDMYYSRAYETYGYNDVGGERDTLKNRGIFYNAMPVTGTVARGDMLSYHLTNDSTGLTAANSLKSPLDTLAQTGAVMKEAERIYLVNCGICHGTALDGNGPLYNNGKGPYPAMPKNLTAADSKAFTDGHYFHVITYGKGSMGSYASQLTPQQRWWVIKYIRSKQGAGGSAMKDSTGTTSVMAPAKKDSAGKGK